jgi:protocatechuate 3,4-dioxygenase beta subunit
MRVTTMMRTQRMLSRIDLIVRGCFVAAVVAGGVAGWGRRSSELPQLASVAPLVAENIGLAALSPVACAPSVPDVGGAASSRPADVQPGESGRLALRGAIRSSAGCAPIAGALVEIWLAGPSGEYDDSNHTSQMAGADGSYQFDCAIAADAAGRWQPIHMRISARGYAPLVTQYVPASAQPDGVLNLVLQPER